MSSFERGVSPTLSMREKSVLKRRITKEHNSNFRAGYVHVNEDQLHKTGIRGRKRYMVIGVTVLLALTVLINLLITVTVLAVVGIGREGSNFVELIPKGRLIRFLQTVDMGRVYLSESVFGSLANEALELTASENGTVQLKIEPNGPEISVGQSGVQMKSEDGVHIIDPETKKVVFSTDSSFKWPSIESTNIQTRKVFTSRVTSPTLERLKVESSGRIQMDSAESILLSGRTVEVVASEDLSLYTAGDLSLGGLEGTVLRFYKGMPIKVDSDPVRSDVESYKLCVQMPEGELYSVAWNRPCGQYQERSNQP